MKSPPGRGAAPGSAPQGRNRTAHHNGSAATYQPQGTPQVRQDDAQLSLDDLPQVARPTDPGTSWAAARDPHGHRKRIIDDYVVSFARAGRRGLATFELCGRHGGESAHVARRITDMHRLGWVRHEGERKSPRTGRWQRVYVATASGLSQAAAVVARKAAS